MKAAPSWRASAARTDERGGTGSRFRARPRSARLPARRRRAVKPSKREVRAPTVERRPRVRAAPAPKRIRPANPTRQHRRVSATSAMHKVRRHLLHQERHDRRSVPELHRPSRRSAMSGFERRRLLRPGAAAGSRRSQRAAGAPEPSQAVPNEPRKPPLIGPFVALSAGSSLATGRPRSAINTGDPFLRPSISALRLFFASVMLAFFIRLE